LLCENSKKAMVPALLHQAWLVQMPFACIAVTLHVQAWLTGMTGAGRCSGGTAGSPLQA